jgi:rsbT co-antagonist protein RsbR
MSLEGVNSLAEILRQDETSLLSDWISEQASSGAMRSDLLRDSDLREECRSFLSHLKILAQQGSGTDVREPEYIRMREMLASLSASRARQGFTASETATFVFSLKKPLFTRLSASFKEDAAGLSTAIWAASELIDRLGLFTAESSAKAREEVIARQQEEMLELSTPVVKLWDGILALPMIGTLDSNRTQIVMESLLQRIVETGAEIAILDITGVPTVDTLVAQHLLKTVAAARLMGADCIISGIRPQIAQTIVHLGVDLTDVITKATIADAFALALKRTGAVISRARVASS